VVRNLSKTSLIILTFLLLLAACTKPPNIVKVIGIIDGDTIVVEGGYHMRYIGVDAPEKDEPYYFEALTANQRLVKNKKIRLEEDVTGKDKYGRLLRYIYVNNTFVNAELVRQGYAQAKAYPPNIKYQAYLEAMEREARQTQKGIWR